MGYDERSCCVSAAAAPPDYQVRIVALQIAGGLECPTEVGRQITDALSSTRRRCDAPPRHGVEVDWYDFRHRRMQELERAPA